MPLKTQRVTRALTLQWGSYADVTLGSTQSTGPQETKILGVRWNPQTDRLIFSASDIAQEARSV